MIAPRTANGPDRAEETPTGRRIASAHPASSEPASAGHDGGFHPGDGVAGSLLKVARGTSGPPARGRDPVHVERARIEGDPR